MGWINRLAYVLVGIFIGLMPSLLEGPAPRLTAVSEHGGLLAVTPGNTYEAINMAGEYCKTWAKYAVLTETTIKTLGVIRFDCIPHRELTGPLADRQGRP